jgi:hypothetical protein
MKESGGYKDVTGGKGLINLSYIHLPSEFYSIAGSTGGTMLTCFPLCEMPALEPMPLYCGAVLPVLKKRTRPGKGFHHHRSKGKKIIKLEWERDFKMILMRGIGAPRLP